MTKIIKIARVLKRRVTKGATKEAKWAEDLFLARSKLRKNISSFNF